SFTATNEEIFTNLQQIAQLKEANREKFILLLGNHDVQYLHFPYFSCSGFRPEAQKQLTLFFRENRNLFQMAWEENLHLFTHAGVSQSWFAQHEGLFREYGFPKQNLAEVFNRLHEKESDYYCLFDCSKLRGGSSKYGGILWADAKETRYDFLSGYHQVVGHTPVEEIGKVKDKNSSITYIDVLDTKTEFLELNL